MSKEYDLFKKENSDCYIPEEHIIRGKAAETMEYLRRWFAQEALHNLKNEMCQDLKSLITGGGAGELDLIEKIINLKEKWED